MPEVLRIRTLESHPLGRCIADRRIVAARIGRETVSLVPTLMVSVCRLSVGQRLIPEREIKGNPACFELMSAPCRCLDGALGVPIPDQGVRINQRGVQFYALLKMLPDLGANSFGLQYRSMSYFPLSPHPPWG